MVSIHTTSRPNVNAEFHARLQAFRKVAHLAGISVLAIGLVVLAGLSDLPTVKTLLPGLSEMKANTALGFALAGPALWLRLLSPPHRRRRLLSGLAQMLATAVVLVGILTLSKYLFAWDLGIDQLLFNDLGAAHTSSPGRMSPHTAFGFALLGPALLLLDFRKWRCHQIAEYLCFAAHLVALSALIGYAYSVASFYRLAAFTGMSLHTAAAFLVLSLGILFAYPERGAICILASATPGGTVARRLIGPVLLVPLILGWLRLEGQRLGLYGTEFGTALLVTAIVPIFAVLLFLTAKALDITHAERARAEEMLRKSSELLDLAMRSAGAGAWNWNLLQDAITWDRQLYSLFGLEPNDSLRPYEKVLDLIHAEDRERVNQEVSASIKNAAPYEIEFRVIWPDGSLHVLAARGKVYLDETGRPSRMAGICWDITERRLVEEEVRKLNAELEQRVALRTAELTAANKELEAFSYSVSHDLRAPLRHIDGFSRILVDDFSGSLADEARGYLERIRESVRHMVRLLDDLLNLARLGRHELRRQITGLDALVDEVVKELKPDVAGRQVEFRVGSLPYVDCDPALLKQVFHNLLSNAVKYTRPRKQAVVEIGQMAANGERIIFVRDNGVGFSMKYADKLFGVFQRLHRSEDFEGTGVGLATVQRIVQKHGGRVWAEAELDKGATFYLVLGNSEAKKQSASVGGEG